MKHTKLSLFFLFSALANSTPVTSYGMIQEEQITSNIATVADTNVVDEIPETADVKLTKEIDKLISLVQKASGPTRENKIAAACTALGIGSMIAFLTGSLYRLHQNKPEMQRNGYCIKTCRHANFTHRFRNELGIFFTETLPWPCHCGEFKMDVSDFARTTALIGIPIGLLTAGLSFIALNKIIQPKNSSEFNAFTEKLSEFKTALSSNQPLSQDDQIKLEKIIALTSAIFEKNNSSSTTTLIKKLVLMLSGATIFSFLTTTSYADLLDNLYGSNKLVDNNIDSLELEEDSHKLFLIQAFASFLTGAGFTWLVTNKLGESDSLNINPLQEAIASKLYDFLPTKPLAA